MRGVTKLSFLRSALLYDIANYAYIEAHKLDIKEQAPLQAHLISDIVAEGNIDRVNRMLAAAYADALDVLQRWLVEHPVHQRVIDDRLWMPDRYDIHLRLPGEMAQNMMRMLSVYVHEYMVCRVMYDWLSIVHEKYAVYWSNKASQAADLIRSLCVSASGSVARRPLSPW